MIGGALLGLGGAAVMTGGSGLTLTGAGAAVGVPLLSGAVSMEGVGTAAVIAGSATVGSALSKINVPVGSVQYSFANGYEEQAASYKNTIQHTYGSIKDAPKYPENFEADKNGTGKNAVKNKKILEKLRAIEGGEWKKVYKDGYDENGNKISIHYFQSKSGRVFDVDVKGGWRNFASNRRKIC
ncbi:hypothetical protein [Lactovum odontotermitis]